MNKKLEETFNITPTNKEVKEEVSSRKKEVSMTKAKAILDISDIMEHDEKMDSYSTESFAYAKEIYMLGMDVEPRHGAEMFNAAATMMKVALDANNAKVDKRLKLYELELKKQKLDLDKSRTGGFAQDYDSDMVVATREDLLKSRNSSQEDK